MCKSIYLFLVVLASAVLLPACAPPRASIQQQVDATPFTVTNTDHTATHNPLQSSPTIYPAEPLLEQSVIPSNLSSSWTMVPVWQLVVIGDHSLWGLGEAYALQIEQDIGVEVELYDSTFGMLSASQVLEALETGRSTDLKLRKLANHLESAHVVVLFAHPNDLPDPWAPTDMDKCFQNQAAESCPLENFETYTADLKAIWEIILELRQGQPTILRAVDFYNPFVALWMESGVFEPCTTCWENFSKATRLAAEAYNIPFLSRLDAFSGPDHDEDPRLKGLILEDGQHPSQLAAELTARLLAEMGYEPTIRKEP